MKSNRQRGATLALVTSCALMLVFIGFTFFWLAQMLGGGSELQHSTDSGNLNVAKEALRSPKLNVFGSGPFDISNSAKLAEIQKNFSDLQDPATGQVDLLVYNRLVAQALIVALNAADENTSAATANAQYVVGLLTDPDNGIGPCLTKKLSSDSSLDTNFSNIVGLNNLRMLKAGSSENDRSTNKDVSYMLAPKGANTYAGNVYFNIASVPSSQRANFFSNFTIPKTFNSPDPNPGTFSYMAGYTPLNVSGITGTDTATTLMGVPLRPHQMPHIVDGTDFDSAKTSPLPISGGVANSAVPPNAFKAGGTGTDARTLRTAAAVSCAIAGAISGTADYQAAIPGGVIAVANGYGTNPSSSPGPITFSSQNQVLAAVTLPGTTSSDVFSGILMSTGGGAYISASPTSTAVSVTPGCITKLEEDLYEASWGNPQASWPTDITCLLGTNQLADALSLPVINNLAEEAAHPGSSYFGPADETLCTNKNITDPTQPYYAPCSAAYGGGSGYLVTNHVSGSLPNNSTNSATVTTVSAVDIVKSQVIDARSSGSGVTVTLPGGGVTLYTGMTAFPLTTYENLGLSNGTNTPLPPPSLNSLIGPGGNFTAAGVINASTVYNDLLQRMYEIKPSLNLSDPDVAAVFNTTLPMDSAFYIWLDGTQTFHMTNSTGYTSDTTLPYHINLNQLQVDGNPITASTGGVPIIGNYVDLYGEGGYVHPYDCPPTSGGGGSATSAAVWTPSSGKDCFLGIMRFYNFVDLGTTNYSFNCPC